MKRIEILLLEKIANLRKSKYKQMQMGLVIPLQFYRMDTNPFVVELARVTLMIARKIAIDNLQLIEPTLPLDSLDKNIVCQDALFTECPKAKGTIVNQPFLGGKKLRIELGDEYTHKIYKEALPDVKGQPDFCVFWFKKASDLLDQKGRAGLVGINSITHISGKKASLDYIISNGSIIHDAIYSQVWSRDAAVHVSIVNWKKEDTKQKFLDTIEV